VVLPINLAAVLATARIIQQAKSSIEAFKNRCGKPHILVWETTVFLLPKRGFTILAQLAFASAYLRSIYGQSFGH
jgi:hypothetical protein